MERRRFLRRAAAVAALAPFASPWESAAQAAALRVGATANDTYAEAYYAQDMGFFTKAGLTVDLTTFTNGGTVASAVAGGSIDVGISNVIQLGSAVEHNIPFAVIAPGARYTSTSPGVVLIVAKTATLRGAKDFEGQAIAVQGLGDLLALSAKAWLAKNGADPARVRFVELPFSEMAPALVRGTVIGAVISEPSLTVAKNSGARVFADSYDAIAKQFYSSAWFTTIDWAHKNPRSVARFTDAIYAAARWANAHQDASGLILAKYAKLNPEIAGAMTRSTYAESFDVRLFQPPLDVAFTYGLLGRAVRAEELALK